MPGPERNGGWGPHHSRQGKEMLVVESSSAQCVADQEGSRCAPRSTPAPPFRTLFRTLAVLVENKLS